MDYRQKMPVMRSGNISLMLKWTRWWENNQIVFCFRRHDANVTSR